MAINIKIVATEGDKVLFQTSNNIDTPAELGDVIGKTISGLKQTVTPLLKEVEAEVDKVIKDVEGK